MTTSNNIQIEVDISDIGGKVMKKKTLRDSELHTPKCVSGFYVSILIVKILHTNSVGFVSCLHITFRCSLFSVLVSNLRTASVVSGCTSVNWMHLHSVKQTCIKLFSIGLHVSVLNCLLQVQMSSTSAAQLKNIINIR